MPIDPNKSIPSEFVEKLVGEHEKVRPLASPLARTSLWFMCMILVNFLALRLVQEFRPGCYLQLLQNKRFLFEIFTALTASSLLAFASLAATIPGGQTGKGFNVLTISVFASFILFLILGFFLASPTTSTIGSRPHCDIQVLILGLISAVAFFTLIKKGYFRATFGRITLIILSSALVPAALMQLACMYGPWHGLFFHFGPILIIVLLGAVPLVLKIL